MMQYDTEKLLNVEGWAPYERLTFLSISKYVIPIAGIISLYLIIYPLIFYTQLPSYLIIGLELGGVLGLISSILILWCILNQYDDINDISNYESQDYQASKQSEVLLTIAFSLSCVMVSVFTILFIFLYTQYPLDYDHFSAIGLESQKFLQTFKILFYISFISVVVNVIIFTITTFSLYVSAVQQEQVRTTLHFFNVLFCLTAVLTVFFANQCLLYQDIHIIDGAVKTKYVYWNQLYSIICIAVTIVVFIVNVRRSKILYFITGAIIIALLFINQPFHYHIYRDSLLIRQTFMDNCGIQLRKTPATYVKDINKCEKYLKNGEVFVTTCEASKMAIRWEDDVGKQLVEQKGAHGCLNTKCCGNLATVYTKWFYGLSLSTLALQVFGFALVAAHLYISQRPQFKQNSIQQSDMLFGALLIIIIFGGGLVIFKGYKSPLPPIYPSLEQINIVEMEKLTSIEPASNCTLLIDYMDTKTLACSTCTAIDTYRISVNAGTNKMMQSIGLNMVPDLIQIPYQLASAILFQSPNIQQSTISVQGPLDRAIQFMNKYVYVCPDSLPSQLQVNIHKVIPPPPPSTPSTPPTTPTPPAMMDLSYGLQSGEQLSQYNHYDVHVQQAAILPLSGLLSKQFSNIRIKVSNMVNKNKLVNYVVQLKKITNLVREVHVGKRYIYQSYNKSQFQLYNVEFGSYTLTIVCQGYYDQVETITVDQNQKPIKLNIQLLPVLISQGKIQIVLNQKSSNVALAITYMKEENVVCTSGLIEGECGSASFSIFYNGIKTTQIISLDKFELKNYLIYMQYFPTKKEIQQLYQKSSVGTRLSTDELQIINNSEFFNVIFNIYNISKSEVVLSVYAPNKSKPILQMKPSQDQLSREINEPNLTWLAFCLDGNNEIKGIDSVDKFWNYADTPSNRERAYTNLYTMPLANICLDI